LTTSSGVVTAAAKPPEIDPQIAACQGSTAALSVEAAHVLFMYSYSGNWMHENGIYLFIRAREVV